MKFIWQVSDFGTWDKGMGGAIGVVVHRPHGKNERWIIGYDSAVSDKSRYRMVSMQDGMISHHSDSVEEFVASLNRGGFVPMVRAVSADEAVMQGYSGRLGTDREADA